MAVKKPLEWSPRSQWNIEAIRDYISQDNPVAAQAILNEIRKAGESLRDFPLLRHPGRRPGTRELVLKRYPFTLVYRLTQKKIGIGPCCTNRGNIHENLFQPSRRTQCADKRSCSSAQADFQVYQAFRRL